VGCLFVCLSVSKTDDKKVYWVLWMAMSYRQNVKSVCITDLFSVLIATTGNPVMIDRCNCLTGSVV